MAMNRGHFEVGKNFHLFIFHVNVKPTGQEKKRDYNFEIWIVL